MNVSRLTIASEKRFGAPQAPGADPHASLTLDRLAVGQEGVVDSVDGEPVARRRLLEAGFVAGSRVRFLMATPFGDPLVFSLRGTSIALRRTDARHVRVRI
jgi:Fe2+ transport system protein FeoA